MAGRSSTTFKKRQKELARQDRQKDKAAKREQRKEEKLTRGPGAPDDDLEFFSPQEFDYLDRLVIVEQTEGEQ